MDCPYCKKTMQKGFINGRDSIKWYPEGADLWMNDESVRLAGVGLISAARAESYCCADCRVVITPVPEIEDPIDILKQKWSALTERVSQQSEKRRKERQTEKHQKEKEKARKKDPWEV